MPTSFVESAMLAASRPLTPAMRTDGFRPHLVATRPTRPDRKRGRRRMSGRCLIAPQLVSLGRSSRPPPRDAAPHGKQIAERQPEPGIRGTLLPPLSPTMPNLAELDVRGAADRRLRAALTVNPDAKRTLNVR
jgi:hypothetical protein